MKLVTFEDGDEQVAGVVIGDDTVVPTSALVGAVSGSGTVPLTVIQILQLPPDERAALADAAHQSADEKGRPLSGLQLLSPVPDPQKIIAIGLNYFSHAEEAARIPGAPKSLPRVPTLFSKFPTSLVGHEADVVIPPAAPDQIDWEAELAVVIGKTATRVSLADALDYVGGYTALNDVSARDLQLETPQWTAGKAVDTFAPTGPWLVTADEFPDPQSVGVQARVNGKTYQNSNTQEMIFSVARQIEFITSVITLLPGDIITTGTPAGVGIAQDPPVFLKAGDVVEIEVEGIGVLRNPIVAG